MSKWRMKAMLIVFFDKNGVVHCPIAICSRRTDSQWCLLRGSVKKIEATGRPSETRNFRQLEAPPRQCAISKMFRGHQALGKNGIVTIHSLPTAPTLPQQIFSSSLKRKPHSKGATTGPWMMSKELARML
ncbi:hypothetical protein TNCV_3451501 [Trichonephila clavipes]|nr:hypothetical protein TNCV_3451501 [Trichonephila clavipes]